MRAVSWWTLLLSALTLTLVQAADDDKDKEKNEKKAKIPALTPIGYQDGEIVHADGHSDKVVLRYKEITQKWVQQNNNYGRGRGRGMAQGGYVPQESEKNIDINLSPDVKIRLMYAPPDPEGKDKKANAKDKKKEKPLTAKELAEKDPDYKLGGSPGKKSDLAKGQLVRITIGRNQDRINPQNYGMVIYVVSPGK